MKATVTGGAGYVGALSAASCCAAGHEVTVLDRLLHGQHDVAEALRQRRA